MYKNVCLSEKVCILNCLKGMWSKEEHLQLSVLVFATGVDPALFTVATSPALNPTHCKSRGTSTKPSVHFHMLHSCRCKFSISQVWHPCKAPLLFLPTYAHRAQQPPVRHRSISRWPLLNRSKGKSHLQLNYKKKNYKKAANLWCRDKRGAVLWRVLV